MICYDWKWAAITSLPCVHQFTAWQRRGLGNIIVISRGSANNDLLWWRWQAGWNVLIASSAGWDSHSETASMEDEEYLVTCLLERWLGFFSFNFYLQKKEEISSFFLLCFNIYKKKHVCSDGTSLIHNQLYFTVWLSLACPLPPLPWCMATDDTGNRKHLILWPTVDDGVCCHL